LDIKRLERRRYIKMPKFNLENYEEVKDRLPKFYGKYPEGRVITDIVSDPNNQDFVIFRASLYRNFEDTVPLATGFAYEKVGEGYINKTSHLENCETSAIGRALANITMHGAQRPSKEEMQKVERMTNDLKGGKDGLF
jgi:hypothetical protein